MNLVLYDVTDNDAFVEVLASLYEREDVKQGITSGCGYELPLGWYLDAKYHHCLFLDPFDCIKYGSIFYEELNPYTLSVHVNFLRGTATPAITTKAGELFMTHMSRKRPEVIALQGSIPDTNRAAQRYALRMGWKKIGTMWAPLPGNVSIFEYTCPKKGEENA